MASSSRRNRDDGGLIVALDGPGSSGKSSVGAAAALELGYRFVDTGLLYRAVTWLAIRRAIAAEEVAGLVELVAEVELAPDDQGRLARVLVDGSDVTEEVHSEEVDARVSAVSRVAELRAALLERQRAMAAAGRIIVAGRDIGTVVLPDASLKIYLDASVEERARRRAVERGLDPDGPEEAAAVLVELRRRDELDRTRPVAPLRPAADARILVTDRNAFEDTVAMVVETIGEAEAADAAGRPSRRDAGRGVGGAERRGRDRLAEAPIEGGLTPLIRIVAWGARLIASAVTRVRVEGDLGAIPRVGPVILAANHASNADPVIVGAWLTPRLGRRIHWLGKKELFDWPIVGWMARHGGVAVSACRRSTASVA